MCLFWERGYEGATFDELATAMGISPSSFQNSFGTKQQLYVEAVDLYLQQSTRWFTDILAQHSDAREAFSKLIEVSAEELTRCDHPAGCMISLAGTHMAPECDQIRDMMVAHRAASELAVKARLDAGVAAGDLPSDTDTATLAAFFGSSAESVGDSGGYSRPHAWRWWGRAGVGLAGSGAPDVTTKCDSARRVAVKPCAFGAPLCGCGA
jgi:AcrR family transcriptional regulator